MFQLVSRPRLNLLHIAFQDVHVGLEVRGERDGVGHFLGDFGCSLLPDFSPKLPHHSHKICQCVPCKARVILAGDRDLPAAPHASDDAPGHLGNAGAAAPSAARVSKGGWFPDPELWTTTLDYHKIQNFRQISDLFSQI